MKKFFNLFALLLCFAACSNEDSLTATVDPAPVGGGNTNPYAVTVEEALANLDGVLALIDGETRAGGMRRAVSVDRVKAADVCDLTRSEAALDVEDLLYVVSFGEGNGSAVLGADKRVTPVLAVLDETVLTADDFAKVDTRASSDEDLTPEEEFKKIALNAMVQSSTRAIIGTFPTDPIGPVTPVAPEIETVVHSNVKIGPLVRTKWTQGGEIALKFTGDNDVHYDDYCNGCPAGCVPIAMGQLFAYLQPANISAILGRSYDWSLIGQDVHNGTPTDAAKDEIAHFIRQIGYALETTYTPYKSSTDKGMLEIALRGLGYTGANMVSYTPARVINQLYAQTPMPIAGESATGGHAWLVDGYTLYSVSTYLATYDAYGNLISRELSTHFIEELFHFNLGWGGRGDGHYEVEQTAYYIGAQYSKESDKGDLPREEITLYDELDVVGY